jgi:branched-chain amino acid transport system permease protein
VLDLAIAGLAGGGTYALIGVCIVLLYRVSAVVNFSQTFAPTFAVYFMTDLLNIQGWNVWLSVAVALVLGAVLCGVQGWLMARFFRESNVMIRSTVSMAMAISILAISLLRFHDNQRFFPALFASLNVDIGDSVVTGPTLVILGLAIVFGLCLWVLLNRTRLGIVMRAVSARPVTAELMGVSTLRMVVLVWALAGVVTTAVVVLVAPTRGSIPNIVLLVIPGLAAAVFGAMRSLLIAIVGGILLGVIESTSLDFDWMSGFQPALSFVAISLALLWSQRKETWSEAR